MPAMNGTGPQGAGPMTGRGLGMCNKSTAEEPFSEKGRGTGRGRRSCNRGFSHRSFHSVSMTPEQRKDMLINQKAFIENQLASIDQQINEL